MLNLALVGCGGHAHWHASEFKKMSAENGGEVNVVALCDVKPAQTKLFKEKYFPKAEEFEDFETMLAKPPAKLDGVVILTPHTTHYPQAKAALLAGVNVLVEKPMVTNSEHAYDLWRTQKQSGKLLAIAIQAPYTAEYQFIKGLRDGGELGAVQIIQGWLAQHWRPASPANYTWRHDPALSGGGQMYDSGAHVFNAIMWIMNNPVVEVSCMYDNAGTPVDINGVVIMRFENGAYGSVAIGGNSPGWNVRVSVQTDKMQVITGPHGGFLEVHHSPAHRYPRVPVDLSPGAFTPQRNFVQTLLGKETPQAPVRYGVLLSALMDALYEAADTRSVVKVRPVPAEI